MNFIFLLLVTLLLMSHALFFLRAYLNRDKNFVPQKTDRVAKLLSSSLLLPTAISALFSSAHGLIKIIPWLPIVVILLFAFRREYVKKHPYLLPIINGFLILISFTISLGNIL